MTEASSSAHILDHLRLVLEMTKSTDRKFLKYLLQMAIIEADTANPVESDEDQKPVKRRKAG